MEDSPAGSGQPLYQRIKQELREEIARGEYQRDARFTSQRDVCVRFGVSTATAVRVLNELVSEGVLTRQRGRGTFVAEPDSQRRAPKTPDHPAIAYIVHGEGPHQTELLKGIEAVCSSNGYGLFISDSTPSPEREERALRHALDTGASGVILYPRQGAGSTAELMELRRHNIPVVLLDRHLPAFPSDAVLADNFAVGYQLTTRLVSLGHTRIATLWSEHQCTSVNDRLTGHIQALREQDLPVRPDFTTLRSYTDLSESNRRVMLSALLERPNPPTALLCANGPVLATAAHDLLGLGIRIPDEIDLAGMDDAGPFNLLPLACIAAVLPSRRMGEQAARRLIERIGQDEPHHSPEHTVLGIEVRTRDSARALLRPMSNLTWSTAEASS